MDNIWRAIREYSFIDLNKLSNKLLKILKGRFEETEIKLDNYLLDYKTSKIKIDDLNCVYIIDDKYAIYLGLLYKPTNCIFEKNWFKIDDIDFVNHTYSIFIEKLVYNNDFNPELIKVINDVNLKFNYPFAYTFDVDQYKERNKKNRYPNTCTDEQYFNDFTLVYDNDDKFHTIASFIENKINLYTLLLNNQMSQTIEDNYDISEAIKYYNDVYKIVGKEFEEYTLKEYLISDYEKVVLLEDSLVIYYGLKGKRCLFTDKNEKNGNIADRYSIVIQELTCNELFDSKKFNKVIKNIHLITASYVGAEKYNNIYYRPFTSGNTEERIMGSYHPTIDTQSNFGYVNEKVPELDLEGRYDAWEGFLYYYIVYELRVNNILGHAVTRTTDSQPNYMARTLIKEYEHFKTRSYDAFSMDENWTKCMEILLKEAKENQWQNVKRNAITYSLLAEKVSYYTVPVYIKDKGIIRNKQQEVLTNACNDLYKEFERHDYDLVDYKWKSEELMLECVQKIFGKNKVQHQYRPYFLHYNAGQLSYDVFVFGKNIAFEYQGKQHFEPVEIFGGKENYDKQVQRDKIKKELSEKNNVTLIYINYWEDISVQLIKDKLKEANKRI